jgi:hypothetical protein
MGAVKVDAKSHRADRSTHLRDRSARLQNYFILLKRLANPI